jgi:hypothetical protein
MNEHREVSKAARAADMDVGAFSNEETTLAHSSEKAVIAEEDQITTVIATLGDGDAELLTDLLKSHHFLLRQLATERRRNRDLISQITTSLPNYTKIKEELEDKFQSYKEQSESDRIQTDIVHKRIVNELRKQNAALESENAILKTKNAELTARLDAIQQELTDQKDTARKLQIKLDDITFANNLADFFQFIRNKIILKAPPTPDCPKDLLRALRRPQELDETDLEDEEVARVQQEKVQDGHARAFLTSLSLDPDLILSLYRLNKDRNDDTHDEDFKLNAKKTVKALANQKALGEIRSTLLSVTEAHQAYKVKSGVIAMIDGFLV